MVTTMSEKRKRVKLKPEEFVSENDKIEEGVVHTRLRNKDGRWFDMFDYVPKGIGVDKLTNEGTKIRKKEEKIFTIDDLNKILVDGNKVPNHDTCWHSYTDMDESYKDSRACNRM